MPPAPAARQSTTRYTFADYATWPEDERWELMEGVAYAMTAPSRIHQKFVFEVGRQIGNYLQGKTCEIYVAPFAVRLPQAQQNDEQVDTVVEPDIVVVCDRAKLDRKGCRAAPDWIIEVLSPSTGVHDMNTKRDVYERHAIREYWIIHPDEQWLMVYTLTAERVYGKPVVLNMETPTHVNLFPDLAIDWSFAQES